MARKKKSWAYRRPKVSKVCSVFISRHIRKHRKDGMPRDQSVAVAYSEARERGCKLPAYPYPSPRRHPVAHKDHEAKCCMCGGAHCCCNCSMA
jgi:hypothetical protein